MTEVSSEVPNLLVMPSPALFPSSEHWSGPSFHDASLSYTNDFCTSITMSGLMSRWKDMICMIDVAETHR